MPSSSDDEFGSYGPTTPFKPSARTAKSKNKGSGAGPSSKPVSGASNKRKRGLKTSGDSEVAEISASEDQIAVSSDEDAVVVEPPKAKGKGRKAPASKKEPTINGADTAKGKPKAVVPSKRKGKATHDALENDDVQLIEGLATMVQKKKANATDTRHSKKDALSDELELLRERYKEMETEKLELGKKLEALTRLKQSEPEKALEEQAVWYDAQVKAQETLIHDLNTRLARVEPVTRSGKSTILEFLSRDAVEQEKECLSKDITKLKATVTEKNDFIAKNNDKIADLEKRLEEAQSDLKAEIERSKVLGSKTAPPSISKTRNAVGIVGENLKNTEVLRLYEDATNLLITNVRYQKGKYLDYEDCIFTCIYTYRNEDDLPVGKESKSLSFTLRLFHDVEDRGITTVTSPDQLCRSVHYIPLALDKESPQFVEQLEFLNEPFTFPRHQMPLFMTQLYDKMQGGDASNASMELEKD